MCNKNEAKRKETHKQKCPCFYSFALLNFLKISKIEYNKQRLDMRKEIKFLMQFNLCYLCWSYNLSLKFISKSFPSKDKTKKYKLLSCCKNTRNIIYLLYIYLFLHYCRDM